MEPPQDRAPVQRSSSFRRVEAYIRPHVPPSVAAIARSTSISSSSAPLGRSQPPGETGKTHSELQDTPFYQPRRSRTLRKMPANSNLSINARAATQPGSSTGLASPRTPEPPRSPVLSEAADSAPAQVQKKDKNAEYSAGYERANSPINSLPRASSPRSPRLKAGKIFGNKLASKSATKLSRSESPKLDIASHASSSSRSQVYQDNDVNQSSSDVAKEQSGRSSPEAPTDSQAQPHEENLDPYAKASKKSQHKFGNLLGRKSSVRGEDETPPQSSASSREKSKPIPINSMGQAVEMPIRTAPMEKQERGFRTAMVNSSASRNRSLDRNEASVEEPPPQTYKPSSLGSNGLPATSGSSHGFVSGIRSGGSKAAEGISKAKKGIFGGFKLGRSSSSHEREPARLTMDPSEYKVLKLPLEEQARLTRIAKRLHYCKDKTEFWLPAFPYRCIDYLSDKGTYSEGLYRVPGSQTELQHWMARFDRELDIDLFEQKDLYDVNVVAGMLKRWLSYLPPVIPREMQLDVIRTCQESHPAQEGVKTPEYMKQMISQLPPWNYYLLFAVTGHISFLHNHREQNKMTYDNLFRCFATNALQVEPYIFWWLVWDWRNCWLGCASEEEYKNREYAILDGEGGAGGSGAGAGAGGSGGTAPVAAAPESSEDRSPAVSSQASPQAGKQRSKDRRANSGDRRKDRQGTSSSSHSHARAEGSRPAVKAVRSSESHKPKSSKSERPATKRSNSDRTEREGSAGTAAPLTMAAEETAAEDGGGAEKTKGTATDDGKARQGQDQLPNVSLPRLSPMKPLSPLDLMTS